MGAQLLGAGMGGGVSWPWLYIGALKYFEYLFSPAEPEIQMRCEMLEDHIATLARNIEHLTDQIHTQQVALRSLQPPPSAATPSARVVRFAETPTLERTVPRARLNSYSQSPELSQSPTYFPPARQSQRVPNEPAGIERTETMFSTPERVTKLTK